MALRMKPLMRRVVADQRGESLVETLVAVLIGALSVSMLATAIMVSGSIGRDVQAQSEEMAYDAEFSELKEASDQSLGVRERLTARVDVDGAESLYDVEMYSAANDIYRSYVYVQPGGAG